MSFNTPDFTLAQIVGAAFAAFYPVLVLLGVDLSPEQKDALDTLWAVGLGLFGADAAIRIGRSQVAKVQTEDTEAAIEGE